MRRGHNANAIEASKLCLVPVASPRRHGHRLHVLHKLCVLKRDDVTHCHRDSHAVKDVLRVVYPGVVIARIFEDWVSCPDTQKIT